ncbi:MAG: hypothetical protein EOM28_02760 [Clostridia bacterium]|nr:hypothetical protein [Anaerotignum sp.]NCC15260.1 hypothetical protein [Clostridia bacterium]
MKKILMFVLSALMLCSFRFPVYANSNNGDLTAEEINQAFLTYAPSATAFAMNYSSDYGLPKIVLICFLVHHFIFIILMMMGMQLL